MLLPLSCSCSRPPIPSSCPASTWMPRSNAFAHRSRGRHDSIHFLRAAENKDQFHHVHQTKEQNPDVHARRDDENRTAKTSDNVMEKLKRYGVAGVLSYGLLNTVYYLGTFLAAWFYMSPVPGGLGYRAAAERFIKLFAFVWAGSQVTKLLRAGCALALAPAIDRALTWITDHSKIRSRSQVFGIVVASCFGLAAAVFVIITFLWA